jgi:hypothetical protein
MGASIGRSMAGGRRRTDGPPIMTDWIVVRNILPGYLPGFLKSPYRTGGSDSARYRYTSLNDPACPSGSPIRDNYRAGSGRLDWRRARCPGAVRAAEGIGMVVLSLWRTLAIHASPTSQRTAPGTRMYEQLSKK